jgi:hypothetical protein
MRSTLNQKPADDPHDFVVIPSDHVQVAPSDDEISDLLRAAARQRAESQGSQTDASEASAVPTVDTTFRPSDVNHDLLGRRRTFGRRMMRAFAALLLAFCVGAAAVAWQASGYAFKKVALKWLPKAAVTASLPLEKLGIISSSTTTDEETAQAEAEPQQTIPTTPTAAEPAATKAAAETAQPLDAALSMQSMARDLANVSQEVETLKATIAELKDSQQQMARELARANEKANDRANEPNARAKLSAVQPHPPAAPPARKPVPAYAPSPPVSAAPAYRQPPPYPPTQAATQPAPVPQSVQPYPQAYPQTLPPPPVDTGLVTAPRPPMPVQ